MGRTHQDVLLRRRYVYRVLIYGCQINKTPNDERSFYIDIQNEKGKESCEEATAAEEKGEIVKNETVSACEEETWALCP